MNVESKQKLKRRWFQFSLRTLMIGVTLFCVVVGGYLGWQVKIVRERSAYRDRLAELGAFIVDGESGLGRDSSQRPSWLRLLFGDHDVGYIWLPDGRELGHAKKMFPESFITAGGTPPVG